MITIITIGYWSEESEASQGCTTKNEGWSKEDEPCVPGRRGRQARRAQEAQTLVGRKNGHGNATLKVTQLSGFIFVY